MANCGPQKPQTVELADAIADLLLVNISLSTLLNQVRLKVRDLAARAGTDVELAQHGYPHFYALDDPAPHEPFAEIEALGAESAGQPVIGPVAERRPGGWLCRRVIFLRNLRDQEEDKGQQVDIALQGPRALE